MLKKLLRSTAIAGAALAVAASGLLYTAQAQAAGESCGVGSFCLYYQTNQTGSMAGFTASVSSYNSPSGTYKFVTTGTGKGKAVDNNAASAWNRTGRDVTVYADPSMKGSAQTIGAGAKANLNTNLNKKTSSHNILPAPQPAKKPTGNLTGPCPVGTTDLGLTDQAYNDGKKTTVRLCAISNIKTSSEESNPKSKYYIKGANGQCVVNASVAGPFYNLAKAAKASGITVAANSCYRTFAHQDALYKSGAPANKAGYSNHQLGNAIDFTMKGAGNKGFCSTSGGVCRPNSSSLADGNTKKLYGWLTGNASAYGIKQLASEFWHWSNNGK